MASFAETMLIKVKTLLEENVGVQSIRVGDTSVTYDDLVKQFDFWQARVDREQGTRPRAARIDLSGF